MSDINVLHGGGSPLFSFILADIIKDVLEEKVIDLFTFSCGVLQSLQVYQSFFTMCTKDLQTGR